MIKVILKNILHLLLSLFYPKLKKGAVILMYHSVGRNKAFFTVTPEKFERQLAHLFHSSLKVVPLADLIKRLEQGKSVAGYVSLTFDDGYEDNFTQVFPVLKKYNFPATIFLSTDYVEKTMTTSQGVTLPMLTAQQIIEMKKSGLISFMPHGASHVVANEFNINAFDQDLEKCLANLSAYDQPSSLIFAYPKGKVTPEAVFVLQQRKVDAAVVVIEGLVKDRGNDMLRLPRNAVDSGTNFLSFKVKVSDGIYIEQILKNFLKKLVL
jgi:peptidoglycan/xylan/chitin deacetylase (PgdA/CDA1 family)